MHDCAVCRGMSLACCQKAYTLRCCHAHSFAVLLRQHAGCPGKRDPTFAQSLAEVLVVVHQRHLMLTALYLPSQCYRLRSRGFCQRYVRKTWPVANTITRKSSNISINKTQATPTLPSLSPPSTAPNPPPAQTPERLRHFNTQR